MLKHVLVGLVLTLLFAVSLAEISSASAPLPTGTEVDGECVWLYQFPDAGHAVCVDQDGSGPCTVWFRYQTIAGPYDSCQA